MPRTSHWPTILLLWFAGVMAAAQLGKMAALIPAMRADLDLSLAGAGLMVSLIETAGATLGGIAGILGARVSGRRVLLTGVALIIAAGLGAAAAPSVGLLYAARLIESIGYLLMVIAAPSLIAVVASPSERGTAMVLWSTFVPVGVALGTVLSGVAADLVSWRTTLAIWAVATAMTLPGVLRLPTAADIRHDRFALPPLPVWWLALGFGCYTTLEVGVLAMLPAYLSEARSFSLATAGTLTGVASAATIVGSFLAARLLMSGGRGRPMLLIAIGLALPVLLFAVGFPPEALAARIGGGVMAAAIICANAVSGIVAAVAFARLPDVLQKSGGALALVTAANGIFTQCGAAGSLIGPPLIGHVASGSGWGGVPVFVAVMSVASLVGFAIAERLANRSISR